MDTNTRDLLLGAVAEARQQAPDDDLGDALEASLLSRNLFVVLTGDAHVIASAADVIRWRARDKQERAAVNPTLALAQFTSPMERRVLWLSLYAAAVALDGVHEAIAIANRGVVALSAEIVGGNERLPSWLREHDDEDDVGAAAIAQCARDACSECHADGHHKPDCSRGREARLTTSALGCPRCGLVHATEIGGRRRVCEPLDAEGL